MENTPQQPILIRKRGIAHLISLSPRAVDSLVAARIIPVIKVNARLHLFDPEAVKQALAQHYTVHAKREGL
jgi:hypothetical protein